MVRGPALAARCSAFLRPCRYRLTVSPASRDAAAVNVHNALCTACALLTLEVL